MVRFSFSVHTRHFHRNAKVIACWFFFFFFFTFIFSFISPPTNGHLFKRKKKKEKKKVSLVSSCLFTDLLHFTLYLFECLVVCGHLYVSRLRIDSPTSKNLWSVLCILEFFFSHVQKVFVGLCRIERILALFVVCVGKTERTRVYLQPATTASTYSSSQKFGLGYS